MVFGKWMASAQLASDGEGGTSGNAQRKGHMQRRSWVTQISYNESKQGLQMDCIMKFSESSKLTD